MILLISVDRAIVDLEHHIHAVLIEPDDLRIDPRVVVAALGVQIEDTLPVLLGQRRREHRARLELHLRTKLVIGQLVVALEGDAVDQRVLDQTHDQRIAFAVDPHVLEQAGGVERLQAAIEPVGIERVARLHQHVGQDRPGLDSLVALDLDRRDGAFAANRGRDRPGAVAGRAGAVAAGRCGAAGRWAAADPGSQIGNRQTASHAARLRVKRRPPSFKRHTRIAPQQAIRTAVQTTGRLWPAPVGGNGVAWVAKPLQLSQDGRNPRTRRCATNGEHECQPR